MNRSFGNRPKHRTVAGSRGGAPGGFYAFVLVVTWLAPGIPAQAGGDPPLPPLKPVMEAEPTPPLPPPRPVDVDAAHDVPVVAPTPTADTPPPAAPAATVATPDLAAAEQACTALLASRKVVARTIAPVTGTGGCGMPAPVEVLGVLADAGTIALQPPVQANCAVVAALADWVRDDLVPAFARTGKPLATLWSTSGYACRGRNGQAGAKLSEHGTGNAIDIGGFASADGMRIGVDDAGPEAILLAEVKRTACLRFATVLGPGSDGFHETHMHVDLAPRRNGAHLCHWDMH